MFVPSLPNDWITPDFLRLLVQNLVVEERDDIRDATLNIWTIVLTLLQPVQGWMEALISPQLILDWFSLAMTPLGVPIDPATLYYPSMDMQNGTERHNVDKNMLAQDLSLVPKEIILRAHVAAAKAFAWLIAAWPVAGQDEVFRPMLEHYIKSPSMLQKFLSGIIVEEWALKIEEQPTKCEGSDGEQKCAKLVKESNLALDLSSEILGFLQSEPPTAYHEMALSLARILGECTALLQAFLHDCKVPAKLIPQLGTAIDVNGTQEGAFTIEMAQRVFGPVFMQLKESLGRTKKELITLHDKRLGPEVSIQHYKDVKNQHDIRVSAAFASAFVALNSF